MFKKVLFIAVLLTGCNHDEFVYVNADADASAASTPTQPITPTLRSDFTPLSPLSAEPYTVTAIDAPVYLEPIFSGMTESYVYIDNATVHSNIEQLKRLDEHEITPQITYRYRVKMDIVLSNDLCVSTWFWKGENVGWSYMSDECNQNYPVYEFDDAMAIYGNLDVRDGANFTLTFQRAGDVTVLWNIR